MLTRTTTFKAALLAAASAFALASGEARAMVITTGCVDTNISCTLAELFGGGSIQVDDKIFENWVPTIPDGLGGFVFSTSAASGFSAAPAPADPAQVRVSGVEGVSPGVRYTPSGDAWSASTTLGSGENGSVNQQSSFGYTVRVDLGLAPHLRIHDNEFELSPGTTGFSDPFLGSGSASLAMKEFVYAGLLDPRTISNIAQLGVKVLNVDVINNDAQVNTFANTFDNAVFAPQTAVTVLTDISVGAGELNTDTKNITASAAVGTLESRFSQISVPEPASLGLFGAGLSALAFLRRRRERKN